MLSIQQYNRNKNKQKSVKKHKLDQFLIENTSNEVRISDTKAVRHTHIEQVLQINPVQFYLVARVGPQWTRFFNVKFWDQHLPTWFIS